jgi:hypothetical protein
MKHPLSRLLGANNTIALHRDVIRAFGSYEAAALCEQVVYWMPRAVDPDGWVYKSAAEWQEELCLTVRGFQGARDTLERAGILKTRLQRVRRGDTYTRVLSVRVDLDALYNAIGAQSQLVEVEIDETSTPEIDETSKTTGGETCKPDLHETSRCKEQRLQTETTNRTTPLAPQGGKGRGKKPEQKIPELPEDLSLVEGLPGWWANWIEHRHELRCPLTAQTAREQFEKLRASPDAVRLIRHSIGNGWRGLFEPKDAVTRLDPRPKKDFGNLDERYGNL